MHGDMGARDVYEEGAWTVHKMRFYNFDTAWFCIKSNDVKLYFSYVCICKLYYGYTWKKKERGPARKRVK